MRTLIETLAAGGRPALLLALLTGTYSKPEDFIREGFLAAIQAHGIEAEVVMAEVRAAYFADGSIVRRIRESVVLPGLARGRSRIWLAGISLGGLAALSYAARHEDELEGLLLISPYPATRAVLLEMDEAGGPANWKPAVPPEGDFEREAWRWLCANRADRLPVHCYFGSDDRFAAGQRRMAHTLAPERVREMPGAHDWAAWRKLWAEFLSDCKASLT